MRRRRATARVRGSLTFGEVMTDRTTARLVGGLFIVASATAIIGGALLLPIDDRDTVAEIAATETRIVSGVYLELVLVFAVVGIAALLYPVLRRRDDGLAVSYVGARIIEATLLLAAAVCALVATSLSRGPGPVDVGGVELLLDVREWTYLLGSMVALGVGALILYSLLYRARLVPAWLSLWGLAGGALILLRGVLETYGWDPSAIMQGVFAAPIAVNEMVLAVWLIVRGFAPHEATAQPVRPPAVAGV